MPSTKGHQEMISENALLVEEPPDEDSQRNPGSSTFESHRRPTLAPGISKGHLGATKPARSKTDDKDSNQRVKGLRELILFKIGHAPSVRDRVMCE